MKRVVQAGARPADSTAWHNAPFFRIGEASVSATIQPKGKGWDSLHSPSFREFAETRRSGAFPGRVVSTTYEW